MSAPIMNTEPVMVAAADVIRTFGYGRHPWTRRHALSEPRVGYAP